MRLSRRHLLQLPPALLLGGLTGCANAPTRYYRLAMIPGGTNSNVTQSIRIRSISIPGYLVQNGIAKAGSDYEFNTFSNDLWAEPLADMLQSVMVLDLAQRLPRADVAPSSAGIGGPADMIMEMNILRFDPNTAGQIVFDAQLAVKSASGGTAWSTQTLQSNTAPAGDDAASIAAAMSMVWAAAADQAVALIIRSAASPAAAQPGGA